MMYNIYVFLGIVLCKNADRYGRLTTDVAVFYMFLVLQ